jgi:hypothetical protein
MAPRLVDSARFDAFCRITGYSQEQVAGCVVAVYSDKLLIDFLHPQAPRLSRRATDIDESVFQALLDGKFLLDEILEKIRIQDFFDENKPKAKPPGFGSMLKKIMTQAPFHFHFPRECSCNKKIAELNDWSMEECERRIDDIVTTLKQEADNRGYDRAVVFFGSAGKLLLRRVLRKMKKARRDFFLDPYNDNA